MRVMTPPRGGLTAAKTAALGEIHRIRPLQLHRPLHRPASHSPTRRRPRRPSLPTQLLLAALVAVAEPYDRSRPEFEARLRKDAFREVDRLPVGAGGILLAVRPQGERGLLPADRRQARLDCAC